MLWFVVVCCFVFLLVLYCSLCAVRCLLFAVYCLSHVVIRRCVLFVGCSSFVRRLLFVVCWLLFVGCCLMVVVNCCCVLCVIV